MKIIKFAILALSMVFVSVPAYSVTKCVDKNGDLYFSNSPECPPETTSADPTPKAPSLQSKASGPMVFGLQLGMTAAEVQNRYPDANYNDGTYMVALISVGSVKIKFMSMRFLDGYLEEISANFEHEGYAEIYLSLVDKYQHPKYDTEVVHNAFNASFNNDTCTWKFADGKVLRLKEYYTSLADSDISLTSQKYTDYRRSTPLKIKAAEGF